jgi:hypothetical protein
MKNAVFLDVTPRGSCENRRFGGICCPHHQGEKIQRVRNNVSSNWQLLVTANVVPNSLNLFTLMMEATRSSETYFFAAYFRC